MIARSNTLLIDAWRINFDEKTSVPPLINTKLLQLLDFVAVLNANEDGDAYIIKNRFTTHTGYVKPEIMYHILKINARKQIK